MILRKSSLTLDDFKGNETITWQLAEVKEHLLKVNVNVVTQEQHFVVSSDKSTANGVHVILEDALEDFNFRVSRG